MIRRTLVTLLAVVVLASCASAQGLKWQPGQVLLYRVEHTTFASDARGDTKNETKSVLKLVRRWQATAVDAAGVATLQMSLTSMMQERTTPAGEVLRFDSAHPEQSTPQLKAMAGFLNKPLATLRVDGLGKVVAVTQSVADASGYENELPFLAVLPGGALKPGQAWERSYKITLAPPLGTGEKYDAVQRFTCKAVEGGLARVALTTELKAPPKVPADAVPLWQMLPQGEVVFDLTAGRLHSAKLAINRELKGHQGEGSETKFRSTLVVTYAGAK
jgi:hypothetical protein